MYRQIKPCGSLCFKLLTDSGKLSNTSVFPFMKMCQTKVNMTGVINDPLGQPTVPSWLAVISA